MLVAGGPGCSRIRCPVTRPPGLLPPGVPPNHHQPGVGHTAVPSAGRARRRRKPQFRTPPTTGGRPAPAGRLTSALHSRRQSAFLGTRGHPGRTRRQLDILEEHIAATLSSTHFRRGLRPVVVGPLLAQAPPRRRHHSTPAIHPPCSRSLSRVPSHTLTLLSSLSCSRSHVVGISPSLPH